MVGRGSPPAAVHHKGAPGPRGGRRSALEWTSVRIKVQCPIGKAHIKRTLGTCLRDTRR